MPANVAEGALLRLRSPSATLAGMNEHLNDYLGLYPDRARAEHAERLEISRTSLFDLLSGRRKPGREF